MEQKNLMWKYCDGEVEWDTIHYTEQVLGIVFPDTYRLCAKQFHGGTPSRRGFAFVDSYGPIVGCLGALLSLSQQNPENVLACSAQLRRRGLQRVIPFATDGGGDYMCFDYRDPMLTIPTIVYWNHEESPELSLTYLASCFEDFLAMLE
jgi:hypothetical protein